MYENTFQFALSIGGRSDALHRAIIFLFSRAMKKIIKQCRASGVEEGEDEAMAKLARLATAKLFAGLSGDDQTTLMEEREYALGAAKPKKLRPKRSRESDQAAGGNGAGKRHIEFDEELEVTGKAKKKAASKGKLSTSNSGFSDFIKSAGIRSGKKKVVEEDYAETTSEKLSPTASQLEKLKNTNPMNLSKRDATQLRGKIQALEVKLREERRLKKMGFVDVDAPKRPTKSGQSNSEMWSDDDSSDE